MKAADLLDVVGRYTSSNLFEFDEDASVDVTAYADMFGRPSPNQLGTWHFANSKGVEIFSNTGSFEVSAKLALAAQKKLTTSKFLYLRLLPIE